MFSPSLDIPFFHKQIQVLIRKHFKVYEYFTFQITQLLSNKSASNYLFKYLEMRSNQA